MRRLVMGTGALVLAAACSPDPCDVQQVLSPSSNREPGTLQSGVLQHAPFGFLTSALNAPVAARSDGRVLCATCSAIVALDAMLHETGRVDLSLQDSGSVVDIAVAPDDTVYAVIQGTLIRIDDLTHESTADESSWTAVVGSEGGLVAGNEGPYVGVNPFSGVPPYHFTIRGFDAMTGQSRTVASGQYLLAAARGGGVFTVEQQEKHPATLRRLDPAGTVVWSRTLTSTVDGVWILEGMATADGGVSVFGYSGATVDFGDRTLASSGPFVAGFDASGATQWAFALPFMTRHMALTTQGEILIAGETAPGGTEGTIPTNAFLSVVTPTGISRTLTFSGEGDQFIAGLAPTPDGFALIRIGNFKHDDVESDPVIQIGDHMFTGPGYYLFKIVP